MNNRKALIIGCGIAGPAVALFLRRAGIDAEIYEAQAAPDDYAGIFLTVAANGMRVLKTLGLYEQTVAAGFPTNRLVMWNHRGKPLGEVPISLPTTDGIVSLTIKRGILQRILREAALAQNIPINFGKRLTTVTTAEATAGGRSSLAHFTDGTTATGDFILGCDGLHSPLRQIIDAAAPPPTYTGLLSGGGFASMPELATTTNTMHMTFGKQAFFGYLVKPDGEVYWFENHSVAGTPDRATLAATSQADWQNKLLDLHRDDQPLINTIIRNTQGDIGMYPIYDILRLPRWYNETIMLIGDAAHATSPNSGQGASLALEDAAVITQCLRDAPTPLAAFATYEQLRRARAEKIVKYSRQMGSNKALSSPAARWFRDLTMPFFLKLLANSQSLQWLYNYKVDWEQKVEAVRA